MQHGDFQIGARFWTATGEWQCTDVGTRIIAAIKIDVHALAILGELHGPPYAVADLVFDKYDLEACYPTVAERDADA